MFGLTHPSWLGWLTWYSARAQISSMAGAPPAGTKGTNYDGGIPMVIRVTRWLFGGGVRVAVAWESPCPARSGGGDNAMLPDFGGRGAELRQPAAPGSARQ